MLGPIGSKSRAPRGARSRRRHQLAQAASRPGTTRGRPRIGGSVTCCATAPCQGRLRTRAFRAMMVLASDSGQPSSSRRTTFAYMDIGANNAITSLSPCAQSHPSWTDPAAHKVNPENSRGWLGDSLTVVWACSNARLGKLEAATAKPGLTNEDRFMKFLSKVLNTATQLPRLVPSASDISPPWSTYPAG